MYQISSKSVQREPICSMRTDGRTDLTKLVVAFRNFAKGPKKIMIKFGDEQTEVLHVFI
jgi:hypothetical protein